MTSPRSIVIHGHFYQPPREDPWLEEVEREPSAAPFHDWNERIEQECYRAVAAARIPGAGGRIARIVNLYEWMSFNFGPTLLEWLEAAAPDTYAAVLAADRASAERLGHGNAIAMPYHHAILPLSTRREKMTEVRWGIADFRRRFGREPEGMWLPETAIDEETLDVLAAAGIRFTVVAPHQLTPLPPQGEPALVTTTSGKQIAVFPYDGGISHDVAFGPLVRDAAAWVERLLHQPTEGPPPALVSVATDGETYGHHHRFAEMALARTVETLRSVPGVTVENYASYLARHPAQHLATLVAPSSWSCIHGVERWRSDCGCRMAPQEPTSQAWRTPLRRAMAGLAAACHGIYDREAPAFFTDPAAALEGYGAAIGAGAPASRAYAEAHLRPGLDEDAKVRAVELLELERGALRTLTSCAWFFDDIGGIEPLQVLRYAAWAVGLAGADAAAIEGALLQQLGKAESNVRTLGTGREIYLARARPTIPPPVRVAAGLAATRLVTPRSATSPAWSIEGPDQDLTLTHARTGRRFRFQIEIEVGTLDLVVRVKAPGDDAPALLVLDELPERLRTAIHAELRTETLDRLLTPEEQGALERGAELRPLVRGALLRSVRALEHDRSPRARQAVLDLVRVLEGLGQAVPFDAQTAFYYLWKKAPPGDLELLGLARRLGFDTTALE
jgi:hypothetical protein